jgi:carbonic anhydrase/acetyltransferase-like protein (isoleucine patch superfamily)
MIYKFKNMIPKIDKSVYIAPSADIIGDVVIGENSSVWFGAVLRGDIDYIKIGKNTSIQDNAVIHVTGNKYPTIVKDNVVVAHGAILHGCTIEDGVMVGMGAIVLDNAVIGKNSIVAAGALVKSGDIVPENVIVAGIPAKVVKKTGDKNIENHKRILNNYSKVREEYLNGGCCQMQID